MDTDEKIFRGISMQAKCVVMFDKDSLLGQQIESDWTRLEDSSASHGDEIVLVSGGGIESLEQAPPNLVLLVSDSPDPSFEKIVIEKCRALDIQVLPIFGRASTVIVGPLEQPGEPGCVTCLQIRWQLSNRRFNRDAALREQFGTLEGIRIPLSLKSADLSSIATIVINEVKNFFSTSATRLQDEIFIYNRDAGVQWFPLLPSHDCPRCSLLPADEPQFGQLHFQPHLIADLDELRVRDIDFPWIESLFVNEDIGYVSDIHEHWSEDRYVCAHANVNTAASRHFGHGSGFSSGDARKKAVLEAIERICAMTATDRNPTVFDSYENLQSEAMNPRKFGLHSDDAYENLSASLEVFQEEKKYSWVWAYSTMFDKPVLIPEQVAYYGKIKDPKRFIVESSNGCALGGTQEEAILHGLFEVLERDGFLSMWFGQLPVPELKVGARCPVKVRNTLDILAQKGYRVRLFNVSHDLHIPAIVAIAEALDSTVFPQVVASSACHLNPYEAAYGALRELAVQVLYLEDISENKQLEALEMLKDSSKITDMMEHVIVGALPEARSRWRFLLERVNSAQAKTIEDTYEGTARRYEMDSRDIRLILNAVLKDLHQQGFEVIVMNQTNVEASYADLHALKVLIPGMMPITFGHGLERWQGLQRIFELPYQMGYADHILTSADLNAYPHPFS